MMNITSSEIASQRLFNQQLINSQIKTPQKLVGYFGAMQAQDYAMAKWAIGIRLQATEKMIDEAINRAQIIRTHIFRGTWHFVAAEDIRWMLQVTAPHGKKAVNAMFKKFNLDERAVTMLHKTMEKLLARNNHLTRDEIILELNLKKIIEAGFQPSWLTISAELDGLICNGLMRGKEHTYALLEEKVPAGKTISREEALAKLATIYFTSHGPATLQDFIWWTGLTVTEAKLALEFIKPFFQSVQMNSQTYLFNNSSTYDLNNTEHIYFLPAFDEFLIGYTDRTASISKQHQRQTFTNNGIFKPVIVVNGEVKGTWKRTLKKDIALLETHFFAHIETEQKERIWQAAEQYGQYSGLKIMVS